MKNRIGIDIKKMISENPNATSFNIHIVGSCDKSVSKVKRLFPNAVRINKP
jgi:hypothetical protein